MFLRCFGELRSAGIPVSLNEYLTLMQAMAQAIRLPVIRGIPVPLCQWLIGPASARDIGIGGAVPWPTRLAFGIGRFLSLSLDRLVRRFRPNFSLSRMLVRVVG